ncbi:MAG: carbohydrate ABC transporter permease [Verrucomicrobiota bacterium]|nr:carbohydrate ABC transporter permease [Verrucomicrobiota bacterium]
MSRLFSFPPLLCFLIISLYPFAWMFFSSFKTNKEIYQPSLLLPETFEGEAYEMLLDGQFVDFESGLWESVFIAVSQSVLATFVSATAGFVLAKYSFRGKTFLIGAALIIILIPRQALVVPIFEWFNLLGWVGNSWSLVLCGIASGLGVCFFAQSFKHLPDELMEISKLQGLSPVRIFILILPLFTPGLVTYFLLHFALCWQEHLLALLLLGDDSLTLPLALAKLSDSSHRAPEAIGMAAATLSFIPIVVLFALFFGKMKTALSQLSLS